jgi:hypothetical protein
MRINCEGLVDLLKLYIKQPLTRQDLEVKVPLSCLQAVCLHCKHHIPQETIRPDHNLDYHAILLLVDILLQVD